MINKNITVEIIGKPETGKTDFCSRIPNVALCDITFTKESDVIFAKYHGDKELDLYYEFCDNFADIKRFIDFLPSDVKTFVLDGSQWLNGMVERAYLDTLEKSREKATQKEYGFLNKIFRDELITPLRKKKLNIVFTSGLKKEYVDGKYTGVEVRHGFSHFEGMRDIGLYLYIDENGQYGNKIIKNRFMSKTIMDTTTKKYIKNPLYITSLEPEATWETLINMITAEGSAIKKEWLV